MEFVVKKFEVTKEISDQINKRLLFALKQEAYTVNQFIEKKYLDGTQIRCLLSGVKLYEKEDLHMIADATELSKDFFLLDTDDSDDLKLTLYYRYCQLNKGNRKAVNDMMDDIFSILF